MKRCLKCQKHFDQSAWTCPYCHYMPLSVEGFLSFAPELSANSEGFEAHFFNQLVTLEARNFWFRARNQLIIWALQKYFPKIHTFLEVGCGTGFVLSGLEQAYPQLCLQGSEIFTSGLELAAQRLSQSTLFQMDACAIPFVEEFDVIGAFDVLEHIQNDALVLSEIYRATRKGLILTVPQHPWLWSQADDHAHHFRRYQAKDFRRLVEAAGFRVVRMTSFVSLLLPLMLASRLKQRRFVEHYDSTAELRINPWLNSLLESTLALERQFIKVGISWPMGGSLLLVAYKK